MRCVLGYPAARGVVVGISDDREDSDMGGGCCELSLGGLGDVL